jgi:hypothetical protein
MGNVFFNPLDYQAIKPEILLTMFGLAVLLFDFLLDKRDKYLNAVLALIGLGLRFCNSASFWHFRSGQPAYLGFDGTFAFDSFAIVAKFVIVLATAIVVLLSVKYLEIEDANAGRVLRPAAFRRRGDDVHGVGRRPDRSLYRPGTDGPVRVCADRVPAGQPAIERSGGEILPARRVFLRPASLWHVAALRNRRLDES